VRARRQAAKLVSLRALRGALSIALLFALWTVLVRWQVYRFALLPDPVRSLQAGVAVVTQPAFLKHALYSTYRVWISWMLAGLVAIPLGLMIGWRQTVSALSFPALELLRPIPPIA